jgi:hypothetical protein
LVDKEQSYRWLRFGDIKGETGSTVVAAEWGSGNQHNLL